MVNSKGMSNNSPKPKDNMSDSSPYDEFDLYNYTVQAQNWIMVGRVVGVVCLLVQALFLAICVRVGYVRGEDLNERKEEKS